MAKICSVQVEILLTAYEKAILDHYVKEQNQRYKKRGATRNWWTLEKLLQCLLSDITYQAYVCLCWRLYSVCWLNFF